SMPVLDLSDWHTMTNSTDSLDSTSPVYGMFTGLMAKKIVLGTGFLLKPVMPSSTGAMNAANDTTWIGVGAGTEDDPQGLLLVNTSYTGDPNDADTYLLVGAYVNYVDVDTGSQLKQVILPATVTSYTATVPDGYVLATGQKRTFAIQAANKPTVYTVNVTTPKPALPDASQTMTNLTVKYVDAAGNELQTATVQSGQVGTDYTVSVPAIKGYTTTAKPISGQFKGNNMVLTLTYVKDGVIPDESANTTTMTINYVDQDATPSKPQPLNRGRLVLITK
uniref:MucBP domain-containing protein n=1 Tax=Secundilactobacillus similis TaxID=414682 RepID=UPI000ABC5852